MHKLQQWREHEAMGIYEASQAAGIHHEQWKRIEDDDAHQPSAGVVHALIALTGLQLSDFVDG